MSVNKLRFLFSMVLLFVLFSILTLSVGASSNQKVAISAITEAEQSMALAYEAVLDAEEVGANVSCLLIRLNDATGLLSEAQMAFEVDNFEEAIRFAELSSEVGFEVGGEAERLEVEASQARVNRMWGSIVGAVLAVSIVLFASLLGYRIFKRRYYRRLLKMKPKVGQI